MIDSKVLDGKKCAEYLQREIIRERELLFQRKNTVPGLAVIEVGNDPSSRVYWERKKKLCEQLGFNFFPYQLEEGISQNDIEKLIIKLNEDEKVHGIIVQLPLPSHLNERAIVKQVNPFKDVDGLNPLSIGNLAIGQGGMRPCTPAAVIALLDYYGIQIEGKHVVILGRSNIVGKPLALMLINRGATVTVCHSKTVDLTQYTKGADILCVAIGKPNFVKNHMVKEGSIVIDIGINQLNGKITGDVDYSDVFQRVGRITPVPGGIGALTSMLLMRNTLEAAKIL